MSWARLRTAARRRLEALLPDASRARKAADAKVHWLAEALTECPNAPHVYAAATPDAGWQRILEFGANNGGNLVYFLDHHPGLRAVGVDINPAVKTPEARYPAYQGIVGDESALEQWQADTFDLAFTVSVLDHIPSPQTVEHVLRRLVEVARRVVLLEPVIAGVHGDVSGRTRAEVAPGLPAPHKRFAPHCYIWDYDGWLARLPVTYTRTPYPLHAHSLGPFYHLYVITRRA